LITLLVVAHPAVVASMQWAPPPSSLTALPRIWQAFLVVHPRRLDALGLFAGFHDMFFMALMFFISGLLVWRSLACKGVVRFLGRALGLGLRRWWLGYAASLLAFAAGTGVGLAALTLHLGSRAWEIAGDSTFVLSSAASSFAFLALFIRFAGKHPRILGSRNGNAYGIYLVHYAFVSWVQQGLLKLELPAIVKGPMVLVSAGLLSWGTVALIRRIPLGRLTRHGA